MVRRGWMVRVGPVGEWLGRMTPGRAEWCARRGGMVRPAGLKERGSAPYPAPQTPAGLHGAAGLDGAQPGGMRAGGWMVQGWAEWCPGGLDRAQPDGPADGLAGGPTGGGWSGLVGCGPGCPRRAPNGCRPTFHSARQGSAPEEIPRRAPGPARAFTRRPATPRPPRRSADPATPRPPRRSAGPAAPGQPAGARGRRHPAPAPPAAGAAARRHLAHPDGARTWRHPASLRERGADGTPPLRHPAPAPLRRRSGGAPLTCDPSRERFVSRGPPPSRR